MPEEDKGIQRDKPPSTRHPRARAVAVVALVALMGSWFVLEADHSSASNIVLVAGLVLSVVCLVLSAAGTL